jgi:hypothetical protein
MRRLLTLTASGLLVAACTGSPGVAGGQVSAPARVLDLDGSALHAVEARPYSTPLVSSTQALQVLARQTARVTGYDPPMLARVNWKAGVDVASPPGRLPRQGGLSWVLVYRTIEAQPSCPFFQTGSPPPWTPSQSDAVIVDATTGAAAIYAGSRPVCAGWTTPTIGPAHRYWSAAWTRATATSVRATVPPCGVLAGSWAINDTMFVIAAEPYETDCATGPTTVLTSDISSTDWNHVVPGPVGPVCAQPSPGVRLPLDASCVKRPSL